MNRARAVLFALLTAAWLVMGATLAAAVVPDPASVNPEESTVEAQNSTEIGSKISSFMQANAAQTNGAIENGMWVASYNGTNRSGQAAAVESRTRSLQGQLQQLEREKQELIRARQRNEISQLQYEARMSAVIGAYLSLTEAIEAVEPRAKQSGADVEQVETLRERARDLPGPEVAAVARNMNGTADAPGLSGNGTGTDAPGASNAGANASNANGTNGNDRENGVGNASDAINGTVNGSAPGNGTGVSGVGNGSGDVPGVDDGTNITGPILGNDTDGTNLTDTTRVTSVTTESFDADAPGSNVSGTTRTDAQTDATGTTTDTTTTGTTATDTITAGNASTLPFEL